MGNEKGNISIEEEKRIVNANKCVLLGYWKNITATAMRIIKRREINH